MSDLKELPSILGGDSLQTPFAEAYRALRTNISLSGVDQPPKTIVVTSALSNEGKTTTVINLGIIMAQAGPRVLIVDTDFRKPSIHEAIRLYGSRERAGLGLSNVIVGMARLGAVIMDTAFQRLQVVP